EKLLEKSRDLALEVTKKLREDSYIPPKEMSENQRIKSENEKIDACKEASQSGFNMQCTKNKMEMVIQGLVDGNMLYILLNEMPDPGSTEIVLHGQLGIAEESAIPGVRRVRRETKIYGRMPAVDLMKLLLHYDMPMIKIENRMILRWTNPNYK